ncbi:hypothetical protein M3Y97_01119900 [Aphelenchoides bicaudatus]|nr:hypothetical protein M3Y97_01119900 [Aphelenchoides bicaudatus]
MRPLYISPKQKINVCVIEKNMSTILTAIICYLFDSEHNTEVFNKRSCQGRNELLEFVGDLNNYTNVEGWLHLAVSRDPIERFVSSFVDKCVIRKRKGTCQNCKSNVTCFIERMHRRMLRYSNDKVRKYKLDESHFYPQNWRCNFSKHFGDYTIIPFNNSKQLAGHTTGRVERKKLSRLVRQSPYLIKKLVEIYYYDFVLFGYEMPKIN